MKRVRWLLAAFAVLVVTALVVAVVDLAGRDPRVPAAAADPTAADPVGRTSAVAIDGSVQVNVHPVDLDGAERASLVDNWPEDLPMAVGVPVEVEAAAIPAEGIKITRHYVERLPDQVASTLAFYDPQLPGWRAVTSEVAPDRKSVSATVHHLSLWTDFIGGIGDRAQEGVTFVTSGGLAAWLHTEVGKAFSTRVDQPKCDGKRPGWVRSVDTIEDAPENPLRYCSGGDGDDLVVKVAVNRGFGFIAHPAKPVTGSSNSSYEEKDFDKALQTAVHLDEQFGQAVGGLLGGKDLVGAGETLRLTYDEPDGRSAEPTVVVMEAPGTAQFIFSVVARLTGTILGSKTDGWVSSGLAIAQCATDLEQAKDVPDRVEATLTCASGMDEGVARHIVSYQNARYNERIAAGKEAMPVDGAKIGGLVGRISIWLALIGSTIDTGDFIAAKNFNVAVRKVSLSTELPNVTLTTLRGAEVPKACGLPQQRLRNNRTTRNGGISGATGYVELSDPKPLYADVAGRGFKQAVSYYVCNQGGVSWPPVVMLTGQEGKLLGHVDLADLTERAYGDRGSIDSFKVGGRRITVRWSSTTGCCTAFNHHSTVLHWIGKGLAVESETITKWSADAVADEVVAAAIADDRSRLLAEDVVSDEVWSQLTEALRGNKSAIATEPLSGPSEQGSSRIYDLLLDTPSGDLATWTVVMVPASSRYGWRMVSAQPQ